MTARERELVGDNDKLPDRHYGVMKLSFGNKAHPSSFVIRKKIQQFMSLGSAVGHNMWNLYGWPVDGYTWYQLVLGLSH